VPRYPQIISKPINVDITLWSENHNGLPSVDLVKRYLSESQLIEPMIIVCKQMLKVWGFNDAYTGGLSSYALFLMIVSFLQEKRKPALKTQVNMGETLLEFIRYYGQLDVS
jgi:DNA polymerase sigma